MSDPELTPFELSRVYAKGWTAGKTGQIDTTDDNFDAFVEKSNPYVNAAERERWAQGFKDALRRNEAIDGRKPTRSRP